MPRKIAGRRRPTRSRTLRRAGLPADGSALTLTDVSDTRYNREAIQLMNALGFEDIETREQGLDRLAAQ